MNYHTGLWVEHSYYYGLGGDRAASADSELGNPDDDCVRRRVAWSFSPLASVLRTTSRHARRRRATHYAIRWHVQAHRFNAKTAREFYDWRRTVVSEPGYDEHDEQKRHDEHNLRFRRR